MRFLVLVGSIMLTLMMIVSGTYIHVSQTPPPNPMVEMGFDVCDADPCFLGITPGRTLWNRVSSILNKFNLQRNQIAFHVPVSDSASAQIASSAELYVQLITVTNYSSARLGKFPLAGDFLQKYGLPCFVELSQPRLRLIYPSMTITLLINEHLTPFSTVVQVLQSGDTSANPCVFGRNNDHTLKWLGFASLQRYVARAAR